MSSGLYIRLPPDGKHLRNVILGVWVGMLLTPTIGAICFIITIFLVLVIFIPLEKMKRRHSVILFATITLAITLPNWNKLVSIFPSTDPYEQPLLTGQASLNLIIDSENNNLGTNSSNRWCSRVRFLLVQGQELFLEMYLATVPPIRVERIENNRLRYSGELALCPANKTTGKPIKYLRKADCALIYIFDNMPENYNVVGGVVVITLNSSIRIKAPILPQVVDGNNPVIIQDIRRYFK